MSKYGWEKVACHQHVDDETLQMSKVMFELGLQNYHQMGLEVCRGAYDANMLNNGPATFDGTTADFIVPAGENSQPEVPITVYTPSKKKSDKLLIFLHGGGLIFGTAKGYAKVLNKLATQVGVIVATVEYRLLPDAGDKYAPVDDAVHATKWILANKVKIGANPHSKVGIMGDSSGGQLSLLVALDVKGIDFLVAIYPANDMDTKRGSYDQVRETPIFNGKDMEWITGTWAAVGVTPNDERILPAARKDFRNMPPCLIVAAELDPLRDSVIELAGRIKENGVKVHLSRYNGVTHGFFGMFDAFPKNAALLYEEIEKYVNSF